MAAASFRGASVGCRVLRALGVPMRVGIEPEVFSRRNCRTDDDILLSEDTLISAEVTGPI